MSWALLAATTARGSRRRIRRLVLCGVLTASVLISPACLLVLGVIGEFPSTDRIIVCTVITANQGIESEGGASEGLLIALSSDASVFLDEEGTPVRNYYLAHDCPVETEGSRWGADSLEEAETDWARFVRQRIGEVAAAGGEETVFARYPDSVEDWCEVETTLSCRLTETEIGVCVARGAELSTEALPVCPPPVVVEPPEKDPPPGELVIKCDDTQPCSKIDFEAVPVGGQALRAVTLLNVAAADFSAVGVGVAENAVYGMVGPNGSFAIPQSVSPNDPLSPNRCHPALGDEEYVDLAPGESCVFEVVFQPSQSGDHTAELSFRSDPQLDGNRIQLVGRGLAGELSFSEPDLPLDPDGNPALPAPGACFNAALDPVDSCTPYRTILATNAGPGTITMTAASVAPISAGLDSGFELDPAIPPQVALDGGATQELRIRWCEGLGAPEGTAELFTVNSDDPVSPTFTLALRRQIDCPPGSFPP